MNEVLFIVCICVICVCAAGLIGWVVAALIRQRRGSDVAKFVEVDGVPYLLVRMDKQAESAAYETGEAAEAALPMQEAAPVEEAPAPVIPYIENEPEEENAADIFADDDNVVLLKRAEAISYADAYARLSSVQKGCVDEILAYAEAKEDVKKITTDKAASVYLGKKLVVRVLIRRGAVCARLTVQNNDFCAYTDSAGLNIKEKPVEIKVESPEMVGAVKDIIDITYRDLVEERARREERKREQRRERRRAKPAAMKEQAQD